MKNEYKETVALLLDTAPYVFAHDCFVMKGGTAINLFCKNMPRLSVDIDLVFVDPQYPDRTTALKIIEQSLATIADVLKSKLGVRIQKTASGAQSDSKLFVSRGQTRVKIEVNHVFRGSVYSPVEGELSEDAEDMFEREISVPMLDADELYASKLVAALDRQHPRDLFDVMLMFQDGGITPRMQRAFAVYLAGHNRPMHELLPPHPHDITGSYENEFVGMTAEQVDQAELEKTREQLFAEFPKTLDASERDFLLSLHRLEPNWDLLELPDVDKLPAIKWKLRNLDILKSKNPAKFEAMYQALESRLCE